METTIKSDGTRSYWLSRWTFVLSFFGVWVGTKFGDKMEKKAEILGGVLLIMIGTKILIEHLC